MKNWEAATTHYTKHAASETSQEASGYEWVNCARSSGNRPLKIVRESIDRGKQDTQMNSRGDNVDGGVVVWLLSYEDPPEGQFYKGFTSEAHRAQHYHADD